MGRALKWLGRGALAGLLAVLAVTGGLGDYRPTPLELAVAPYKYSLAAWELSHFPDKWLRKLVEIVPGRADRSQAEKLAQAREYFAQGRELASLQRSLLLPEAAAGGALSSAGRAGGARAEIDRISGLRLGNRVAVEETIEAEISAALVEEGLTSRFGKVFPPVDTVFAGSPHVLVLSPRDRIHRQLAILLRPGMSDEEKERLEEQVSREENLSALVEDTGGVAVYPSVVTDTSGLHYTVVTTAHEWLHHWFFFRPLGRNFWSSPEMTTLNETAATLGGEEIGDRVYTALTGEVVDRSPPPVTDADAPAFNFNDEMRETRLRAEELLAQGKIEEAEAYMEERRRFLVSHGYFIRKINQAFFAFHGSYATSAASVSPVADQLKELRRRSGSVEDFLTTVAGFGSYQEFLDYLEGDEER